MTVLAKSGHSLDGGPAFLEFIGGICFTTILHCHTLLLKARSDRGHELGKTFDLLLVDIIIVLLLFSNIFRSRRCGRFL